MSDELDVLDATIFAAEEQLEEFQAHVIARATPEANIEQDLQVLGAICRSLNKLYSERHRLLQNFPSRALH